jgi:hypothetical protein
VLKRLHIRQPAYMLLGTDYVAPAGLMAQA